MAMLGGLGELHYLGAAAYGLKYTGVVTWIGNFAPSMSYAVYEAVKEGDFRKAYEALKKQVPLWEILNRFMAKRETPSIIPSILRTNYMYMSVGKACMDLTGLYGGPLRLPMENLTDEEVNELEKVLRGLGLMPS